ncbi:inner membrane-spanning protein YciB [Paracoccus sp. (in: a-proteobacteria)]|uniref:inner membrane-spanning protein YciB n=1 Tax=Paracoccus sp. TaxID=267 RepID=UPI0026DEE1CD|nr:septation protein IspZ [Paracoccus sp. (in: a-proteobacteria)]MDO5369418.1 septation protein IspZ [Paracoccus sp. (in: a-proteobacteria)]
MSPKLKAALDYGPLIVFLAVFLLYRDRTVMLWGQEYPGLILATLVFVPLTIAANALLWSRTGELSVMQLVTLVVVVVFGGLTVWLNDPRFIKMKPTLIYLTFAALLGVGTALGRNWLGLALGEAIPLSPEGWRILTHRIIWFCLGLAALNELIWRTQSDTVWVVFKTVGLIVLTMLFFVLNARVFGRYALSAPKDSGPGVG